jgi:hypothetical protein
LFGGELRLKSIPVFLGALVSLLIVGCSSPQPTTEPAFKVRPAGSQTNLVIAPAKSAVGRIAKVNLTAKFAVISFPVSQVPANETRMAIFRAGAKVGEVKISGPAQGTFTVGDITAGAAQEGDEVWAE